MIGAGRFVGAQCVPQWLPGAGVPGVQGFVYCAKMWDRDGAGPAAPQLVVGGKFRVAGSVAALNIATYDPATGMWSALGLGVSDAVNALAVLPNGDLVAGGFFTTAGGVAASRIARLNGSAWSPLGSGVNGWVYSLLMLSSGDLVVGGSFSTAGGVAASCIARWNGAGWSALGSGMSIAGVIAANV